MDLTTVLMILLAISEVLALIPGFADNSIFQLVVRVIKYLLGTVSGFFKKGDKEEKSE